MNPGNILYANFSPRRGETRSDSLLALAIAAAILAIAVLANAAWGQDSRWSLSAFPGSDCEVLADRDGKCAQVSGHDTRLNTPVAPYGQCALAPLRKE
jgi:hypothetical protein